VPSTAKPQKRTSSARKSNGSRPSASSSRSTRSRSPKARSSNGRSQTVVAAVDDSLKEGVGQRIGAIAEKARSGTGTVAAGATAATVGTAVAAIAGRALIRSRSRRKRVLGVPVPQGIHLPHRHPSGVKGVAKQFAQLAGQVEQRSSDVSKASGKAKQAARILS
jgi:hypothetical protein